MPAAQSEGNRCGALRPVSTRATGGASRGTLITGVDGPGDGLGEAGLAWLRRPPAGAACPARRHFAPWWLLVVAALFAVIQCEEHAHWKGPYQWGSSRANDDCRGRLKTPRGTPADCCRFTTWGTATWGKDEAIYNHDPGGSIHQ